MLYYTPKQNNDILLTHIGWLKKQKENIKKNYERISTVLVTEN